MQSTEYRDSYCWFYGIDQKPFDDFDEIVSKKVQGTYQEEDNKTQYVPHFQFEIDAEKSKARPIPLPVASMNSLPLQKPSKKKQNEQKQPSQTKASLKAIQRKDFCFVNYGMGNVHQLNPKLNNTTFNIKAVKGVNPNTKKRAKLRGYIAAHYSRPPPQANIKVHEIKFIPDPSAAKKNQDVKGPYWVYWPSDEPFPEEYSELEKIVRPSSN